METYKNLCKFPIYIKSIGKQIAQNETFECEDNDEMKDLVKQNKIVNFGKDGIDKPEETKPSKEGRKKKQPLESEDNSETEDNKTNTRGVF